ncbi:MAG: hypothetical protein IPJ74_11505 [Saprospiraceae bacterium]|nr:hypothetical protein [Saprospiraceae bacterium]
MIKYLLPTALFLMLIVEQSFAQRPANIKLEGNVGKTNSARAKMDCNDAGTIQFGPHRGQSNDVAPDTIYLCFGDELDILHQGGNLMGDPQSATTPGFGYVFYDCQPSVTGPDLATILTDSCINDTDPIVDENGNPILQGSFDIWVATEQANGNITFINDGFLQAAFNNNVPKPIQFWFAPITLDDFATQGFENGGSCVDVAVDQAFAVVYLNAIEASDINTNASATGCRGSFILKGGLPELDPLTRYNIDISLASDPSVKGRLESVPMHNDTVEFFVPQAGMYNITIADGKSCGTSFTMDMSGCTAVTFTLPAVSALPGDNVCVNVSVENFNGIGTAQFTVQWDPTVLEYASVGGFNPELTGLESGSFNPNQTNGVLTFAWFDTDLNGATVPDSSSLFEICFNVIGALGEESPLTFTNMPTEILVGDTSLNDVGYILRNGIVAITTNEIITLFEQDSVSCPNATDGGFTMSLFGGTPPYSFTWRPLNPPGAANGPFTLANAGQTFNAPNLGAGRYEVVIQDSANPANNLTDTVQVLRGRWLGSI